MRWTACWTAFHLLVGDWEHLARVSMVAGTDGTRGDQSEQAGLLVQFAALGKRECQNILRDKASLGARFGSAVVLNLIFALIFFQVEHHLL